MGLQKRRKILSPLSQQGRGGFDRNWQWIIDDVGPVGDSFESSFFRPETIGPRQQRRTYFSADQEIESLLIAVWQLEYQILPNSLVAPEPGKSPLSASVEKGLLDRQ